MSYIVRYRADGQLHENGAEDLATAEQIAERAVAVADRGDVEIVTDGDGRVFVQWIDGARIGA